MYSDSCFCYLTYLLRSHVPLTTHVLLSTFPFSPSFSLSLFTPFNLLPHRSICILRATKRAQLGILFLWTTSHQEIRLHVWKGNASCRIFSFHPILRLGFLSLFEPRIFLHPPTHPHTHTHIHTNTRACILITIQTKTSSPNCDKSLLCRCNAKTSRE